MTDPVVNNLCKPSKVTKKKKQKRESGAVGRRDVTLTSPDVPDKLRNLSVAVRED